MSRSTVTRAELKEVADFLRSCGLKPSAVEVLPGRLTHRDRWEEAAFVEAWAKTSEEFEAVLNGKERKRSDRKKRL